ncbi:hypothetical protein [Salmonella enterica]|uniref:hypothetical protein n=1 Tax=Salmonella enterica TaxID=28901 RepID=UPI003B283662
MANTLASIEAGATFVSCTVNGIGERCGITETCLLITNLISIQYCAVAKAKRY